MEMYVQYMLDYYHLSDYISKETASAVLYTFYYYAMADGTGSMLE